MHTSTTMVRSKNHSATVSLGGINAKWFENIGRLEWFPNIIPINATTELTNYGYVVRDPLEPKLPCFPEVYEMVHGKRPSGQAWNAWKAFFVAGFGVQKAMWLPQKTESDIVETYRAAAAKVIADAEFQTVVEKSLGGYKQLAGEAARKAFDQVLSVSKEDKAWVLQWIKDEYGIEVK